MGKGLRRSGRLGGSPYNHKVLKHTIQINETLTFTGATGVVVFQTAPLSMGFPEGKIYLLGAMAQLAFDGSADAANISDTWAGDVSVGTAATADITLSGDEVNVIASSAVGPATADVVASADFSNVTPAIVDASAAPVGFHLNMLMDADDVTNALTADVLVTGDLTILYTVMTDN